MKHINNYNKFKIFESYIGKYDNSIKELEAKNIVSQIYQYKELISNNNNLKKKCQDRLYYYDKINKEFVIDSLFNKEDISEDDIIKMGDTLMDKFGTEPQMVEQAFEDCFGVFTSEGIYVMDDDEFEYNTKTNEGVLPVVVGGGVMLAISLIRFIIKTLRYRKQYKILTKSLISLTRNISLSKNSEDKIQISEYDDRYFIIFNTPESPFSSIKVLKNKRYLEFEYQGKEVHLYLSKELYDEFLNIIKNI